MVLEHQYVAKKIGKAKGPFKQYLDQIMPFTIGASSGIFSLLATQPFDTMKVLKQVKAEKAGNENLQKISLFSTSQGYSHMIRSLYKGLDSAVIRQLTYTGTRMGVYKSLYGRYQKTHEKVPLAMKSLFGLTAGFMGSLVGNPSDLILIRMQSDLVLPPGERRGYKNFGNAFIRIIREEGFLSLFRGSSPTILRAMVLNATQLSMFDQAKEILDSYTETNKSSLGIRTAASAIAGFFASFSSLPFDNIKTKMQKMKKLPNGEFPYKNTLDALQKSIKNEGFTKLWVGFPTFYLRFAPRTMIILIMQDYLTDAWNRTRFCDQTTCY